MFNSLKSLITFAKRFILEFWKGFEYASVFTEEDLLWKTWW